MSYSVDWVAKAVTIPTADLTLVSGTRYQLLMSDFLIEIRRLESEFTEGLWAPQIVGHDNTRPDFAGVDYAPFDEMINGYTIQVSGVATRVDLIGSNNNIIDVLIPTGVSIVPSNSAGLIVKEVGSAVTAQDKIDIAVAVWNNVIGALVNSNVQLIKDLKMGNWEMVGNQMIYKRASDDQELMRVNLFDGLGQPAMDNVMKREKV